MKSDIQVGRVVIGLIAANFDACERSDADAVIDVAAARTQHAAYRAAIEAAELEVIEVAPAPGHPDSVFVEDTAVVVDDGAVVLTRPGAASRRGEVGAVEAALPASIERHHLTAPATLDGGDVLRVGQRLFVGLSRRTNAAGAAQLERIAAERDVRCVSLPVPAGLHLKSACSLADAGTLLYDPAVGLDLAPFRASGLELVAAPEPAGANVLALGNRLVLVSAAAPATAALLRERGARVVVLDMTEVHKADGALTCCSIRLPPPGGWCT